MSTLDYKIHLEDPIQAELVYHPHPLSTQRLNVTVGPICFQPYGLERIKVPSTICTNIP